MQPKVREIIIHGKITSRCMQTYKRLGLEVEQGHRCLRIRSTQDALVKRVNRSIEVDLLTPKAVSNAIAMGCNFSATPNCKLSDDLGHSIILNPIFNAAHSVAVLTSGGDSPGMNSAIRAIVRTALKWGATVYGVYAGYEGLIRDSIEPLAWEDVENYAACGGTQLLSARSSGFVTAEGRRQAVQNLARRRINSLIVLGGDGSMRGALVLCREFKAHMKSLGIPHVYALKVICIPASIDNDIAYADTVLGADTALHRVSECIASLKTTMDSHRRAFVVEVMGRNCGYIALMAGIITEAQFVFLPEYPQREWQALLIEAIRRARELGRRGIIVIVAEGATDVEGRPINPGEVCRLIVEETQIETRVLTLGHIQRGGAPSAHDRILGTISGFKAVEAIFCNSKGESIKLGNEQSIKVGNEQSIKVSNEQSIKVSNKEDKFLREKTNEHKVSDDMKDGNFGKEHKTGDFKSNNEHKTDDEDNNTFSENETEPLMICVSNGEYKMLKLAEVIDKNEEIAQSANQKNFKKVLESRGEFFRLCLNFSCFKRLPPLRVTNTKGTMVSLNKKDAITTNNTDYNDNYNDNLYNKNTKKLAILHHGKLACGIEVALEGFIQYGLRAGVELLIVTGGFQGLIKKSVLKRNFYEYRPQNIQAEESSDKQFNTREVLKAINDLEISGLIVLGDESALLPIKRLSKLTSIGIILIPTTFANNLPGTDVSVGSDTALNVATRCCDLLRSSSSAMNNCAFVVELQGGCGYLSLMAGIASAAFESFIPECQYMVNHLSDLSHRLHSRFMSNRTGTLLLRNEQTFERINTESLCKLLMTDSDNLFRVRYSVLGELLRGDVATPIDRINATILTAKAIDLLIEDNTVGVLGVSKQNLVISSLEEIFRKFDFENGREKEPWWMEYMMMCRALE